LGAGADPKDWQGSKGGAIRFQIPEFKIQKRYKSRNTEGGDGVWGGSGRMVSECTGDEIPNPRFQDQIQEFKILKTT
jgi:hypothetical protein